MSCCLLLIVPRTGLSQLTPIVNTMNNSLTAYTNNPSDRNYAQLHFTCSAVLPAVSKGRSTVDAPLPGNIAGLLDDVQKVEGMTELLGPALNVQLQQVRFTLPCTPGPS